LKNDERSCWSLKRRGVSINNWMRKIETKFLKYSSLAKTSFVYFLSTIHRNPKLKQVLWSEATSNLRSCLTCFKRSSEEKWIMINERVNCCQSLINFLPLQVLMNRKIFFDIGLKMVELLEYTYVVMKNRMKIFWKISGSRISRKITEPNFNKQKIITKSSTMKQHF
jgi:hypothetical protein